MGFDMMEIEFDSAFAFAKQCHEGQVRKYTGEAYIHHPEEVAVIVASYASYHAAEVSSDTMASVAAMHDVMEDCGVTIDQMSERFSADVVAGVVCMSDIDQVGNRAERKRQTRERFIAAPGWMQTIKCADIISNASSIRAHDPKFAITYIAECTALVDAMDRAAPAIREAAYEAMR